MEPITIVATVVGIVTGIVTLLITLSRASIEARKLRSENEKLLRELHQNTIPLWIPDNDHSAILELEKYLDRIRKYNDRRLQLTHRSTNVGVQDMRILRKELSRIRKQKIIYKVSFDVILKAINNLEQELSYIESGFHMKE